MKTVEVKVYAVTDAKSTGAVPAYSMPGDAGVDLRARLDVPLRVLNGQIVKVPVGIVLEIPLGYEGQIRPRSSMSKKGLLIPIGTIDSPFRGELCALIYNLSGEAYEIIPGERIAQLVIAEVPRVSWKQVSSLEDLEPSERGDGGWGSTGRS